MLAAVRRVSSLKTKAPVHYAGLSDGEAGPGGAWASRQIANDPECLEFPCVGRATSSGRPVAWPAWSVTMKRVCASSTIHGGGKRRGGATGAISETGLRLVRSPECTAHPARVIASYSSDRTLARRAFRLRGAGASTAWHYTPDIKSLGASSPFHYSNRFSSLGGFAMLAAMRRASSRVSRLAAAQLCEVFAWCGMSEVGAHQL